MERKKLRLQALAKFFSYLLSGYAMSVDTMELEVVQAIFRHGERTPLKYEHDRLNYLNVSAYEPFGLEHLTNTGKMQAYKIGQMLRERYENFLNDKYSPEDTYARSSENPRNKMTLQLVLAGLFPPTEELRWNPKLDWMPIPYSYSPAELDALLKSQDTKKFYQLYDEVFETAYGIKILAANKDIFDLLDKHGYNKVGKNNLRDLGAVHNILLINERLNLSLPEWYTDKIKQRFAGIFELFHDSQSYTQQMKRLNGGPIIKTFISNMNLNGSVTNPKKLYLYSAHDLNIGAVLRALDIHSFTADFCTTLILEKLRDPKNQVYVRLLYWDALKEKMGTIKIGNCGEFCPIDKFLAHTRDVIPSDEELFGMYDNYDMDYVKKFFV